MGLAPPASGPADSPPPAATDGGPAPAYGSILGPPPAPSRGLILLRHRAEQRRRNRMGAGLLITASFIHLLAIGVALALLKVFVETQVHRVISWSELFTATGNAGVMGLLLMGVGGQIVFSVVALIGAAILCGRYPGVAGPMIGAGAAAIAFSFLVFGGFVGAIAGGLSVAGGAVAWPHPAPQFYYPFPQTYLPQVPPQYPPEYPNPPGGPPP